MSKVRLRDGWGPRFVPLLNREVADGETVEVPDTQPDGSPLVWPETTWEPVTDSGTKAKVDKILNVTSGPAKGK